MTYLQKLNLDISSQKEKLVSFLMQNGLKFEFLESVYCIFDTNDEIIACAGREKNILKCFAVRADFQGNGLTDEILTHVLKDGYNKGYKSFFIFTKKKSASVFTGAGFLVLQETDDSVLLYRSEKSVEDSIKEKVKMYYPDFVFHDKSEINSSILDNKNAAIVMNANPFTLGHMYLIEKALEFCSNKTKLFVFVVENDKSFFSFEERFALVKNALKDIKNVFVLPSSEFLISAATFPSYFLKEKFLVSKNQTQLDARMFLKYFVPIFNIGTRFLGEEPLDESTSLYNNVLQKELPPYCQVQIVPRKKVLIGNEENIISATKVREAYKEGVLDKIKNYVPLSTYEFLTHLKTRHL